MEIITKDQEELVSLQILKGKNAPTGSAVADLGDNVKITADESANALLITGSRSAYDAINAIVRKLDRRKAQVYVEADILDVDISDSLSFGTSILTGSASGGSVQTYGWQGARMVPVVASQTSTTTDTQLSTLQQDLYLKTSRLVFWQEQK